MDIGRLRLAALGLVGPRAATPAAAVQHLTAAQGQDLPGVLASIALRTADGSPEAVRAAFDAGEIVRSWPMRGTYHVVAAEDLAWMLPLGTPRPLAAAATRRAGLGLDDAVIARAGEVAAGALAGRRLTRTELFAAWGAAGLDLTGSRGSHTLGVLAQTGLLCYGPFATPKEQQLVLLDEWVPAPRRPSRDEALARWALGYFRSHGPATVTDLARWTGLPAAEVRAGVEAARPSLVAVAVDGVEHLMDPATPDRLAAAWDEADGELLLPGFDEFVLGYRDRSAILGDVPLERIVPGLNGVFRPTVVVGGRVVGTWRYVGGGSKRRVEKELWLPT